VATDALPTSPLSARRTWRTLEPLHGMIYFAPESAASYAGLGLPREAWYFASRSAPMGAVSAETVVATFFNFAPSLVRTAIPGAWAVAPPEAVVAARLAAADAALRRMLGESVASAEMARAAELARLVAERACERCEGRPLFAGHAGLGWPDEPHLVLWHAETLLREFRGDGHIATLVLHGIGPVEALVLHEASEELPPSFLRDTRGWSDADWAEAAEGLRRRGWLEAPDPARGADRPAMLSTLGAEIRSEIEDATDRLATWPYEAIGDEGCAELRARARPFSRAVVDAAGLGT
jgi:hypothetical protein